MPSRPFVCAFCICTVVLLETAACSFAVENSDSMPKEIRPSVPWWNREVATGDWDGARSRLEAKGFKLEANYVGEVQSNLRGGLNTANATKYLGSVDLTTTLDFEKLAGLKGGKLFLWFTDVHGEGISEDEIGDYQLISNLDAKPFSTLYEYWYRQEFLNGGAWVLGGRFDANVNFAVSSNGNTFIHSSFGHPPNIEFDTYPNTGIGVQAGFKIDASSTIQAMVQDGAANENSIGGWHRAFSHSHGMIGMLEYQLTPPFLPATLPGTYKFGVWKHTGDFASVPAQTPQKTVRGNEGFYVLADQQVFREHPQLKDDAQGLALFAQVARAPENRNDVGLYAGGGFVYTGVFLGRDQDKLGIGAAHAKFSDRLPKSAETAFELYYRVQATPFLSIKPSVEYVVNPNGRKDIDDALAAGVRVEIHF